MPSPELPEVIMSEQFKVNSTNLNLRAQPSASPGNIITTLPKGQIVTKIQVAIPNEDWSKVSTIISGNHVEGFVNHEFLASIDGSLYGIVANDQTLTLNQLSGNKQLVLEVQTKLRNLGFYPGGQWLDGILGNNASRTRKGLNRFCSELGISPPTAQNAIDPTMAKALLEKQQVPSVLEQANDQASVFAKLADIQANTPILNGSYAYLDRSIKNSPFESEIKNFPTYLAQQPDGINLVSYGDAFSLPNSGRTVTFGEYPSLGKVPEIDQTGLEFLDGSIGNACVCVGSFGQDNDIIKAHWLGRKSFAPVQFLSSTKFIAVLNSISQLNKRFPNSDIDNCAVGGGASSKRYSFPSLVEDMVTYKNKIASSNSIAAMMKRFSSRKGLEDWTKSITGSQSIEFRGGYGADPFIDAPVLFDTTLPNNQIVLKSAPLVGSGSNFVTAYDLTRLISMIGWHLHLPSAARLPDSQWSCLESVVRAMGLDTARYIDVALETLGLVNVVNNSVIISKLGLGNSALTYVAFASFVDVRHSPPRLRTISMALWTSPLPNVTRDNRMASAVTEIIRRIFTEELA